MARGLAVVTGGASSAGLAIARRLAADGRMTWICDADVAAVASLAASDPGLRARLVDVLDSRAVAAFFAEVRSEGAVEVLVNTVGLPGPHADIETVDDAAWERTLQGSVGASFYCIREVVPGMKAAGHGVIVNVSSSSTRTGLPMRTPYVVAKFAVEGLTRNLARELGPHGIRVNAILPGAIDNARLDAIFKRGAEARGVPQDEHEREMLRFISMRTKIAVDELAATVAFLASDGARHITGQLLAVDGNAEWEG